MAPGSQESSNATYPRYLLVCGFALVAVCVIVTVALSAGWMKPGTQCQREEEWSSKVSPPGTPPVAELRIKTRCERVGAAPVLPLVILGGLLIAPALLPYVPRGFSMKAPGVEIARAFPPSLEAADDLFGTLFENYVQKREAEAAGPGSALTRPPRN